MFFDLARFGGEIHSLTLLVTLLGGSCLLAMEGLLLCGIFRFRRANGGRPVSVTANSWLGFGLAATCSLHGAFFYLLVGVHGLHILAGLLVLGAAYVPMPSTSSRT